MNLNDFLWVEKYRPNTINDCVLPDRIKNTFLAFVEKQEVPNLLLVGPPGVGKTSVAKAMCDDIGVTYFIINGSKDRGIDMVRNQITDFASTISLDGKKKVIIVDEADGLTPEAQKSLNATIEEFSVNCTFVFTCNQLYKLIDPILSRCVLIDFRLLDTEKDKLKAEFLKKVYKILDQEKVKYSKKIVAVLVITYFPDYRHAIGEIQSLASSNSLEDDAILKNIGDINGIKTLYTFLKSKNLKEARQWYIDNYFLLGPDKFFKMIYDSMKIYVKPDTIPALILILANYQYKAQFVVNQEINSMAALTEIMTECEFL